MRKDLLVFGSPLIEDHEVAEVVAKLRSEWVGAGPRVSRFEEMFKEYTGARHAIAVSSCTAALHLSMIVSGVGPGDYPNAEYIGARTLSLPLSPKLSDHDVEDVVEAAQTIMVRR
jgi:dTDP-4-amino-4,6-dideoxygalactose transaminase